MQNSIEDFNRLYADLNAYSDHMLGYPSTRLIDFRPLYKFLDISINNVGDPFSLSGSYKINTHQIERNVIRWFANILSAGDMNTWGYVTNGGTEGNMYGIYLARELFPEGIVYYSEDTHYSVSKILQITKARSIMIKSRPDGEIDYDDLAASISIHRDKPPIIFANIGTTMRGAVDNLDIIKTILKDKALTRYYIHADAALSGMILPFATGSQPFDFSAGIDSISISGHKFPGCPIPCGVVLAKQEFVNRVARNVEYIGTNDTTISGSRNGVTPLFLWHLISTLQKTGFRRIVKSSLQTADYAIDKMAGIGLDAWRHKNSITVVFPRTRKSDVLENWQIALQGKEAHLITMPHITKNHIDQFVEELAR